MSLKEKFGDVCSCDGKDRPTEAYGCGGFAYGGLAHQYDWPNAPVTQWKAGSVEDVALWFPYANHGGGYSYRLCKKPVENWGWNRQIWLVNKVLIPARLIIRYQFQIK